MSRLALSDADKQARDWFVHTAKTLGCNVKVDAMGNIFAVRPGRRSEFPPTCAGSHLDTQPTGGRYDGILGVCSGLEMLQVLYEEKIETEYPWHTIIIKGQDCHTGTTDFSNRADALLTAAKLILHSHKLAARKSALASTGIIRAEPGSTNTVPGWVQLSLDIRAGDDQTLMDMEEQLKYDFDKIAEGATVDGLNDGTIAGRACSVQWTLDAPSRAVKFDSECIDCVRRSAEGLFGYQSANLIQDMISGAGKRLLEAISLCKQA
ncbi:MAG: hypothetical protein Q9225_005147 [Loekoesia sp. 1 TL-2023]